jgi:hypothetical protein
MKTSLTSSLLANLLLCRWPLIGKSNLFIAEPVVRDFMRTQTLPSLLALARQVVA